MIKSPKLTAEWENDLTLISRGQKNVEEFLFEIEKTVTKLVSDNGQPVEEYQKLFSDGRKEIGKCPRCDNKVYVGKRNYYCSGSDCSFTLWKNNRFFESQGKTLDEALDTIIRIETELGYLVVNGNDNQIQVTVSAKTDEIYYNISNNVEQIVSNACEKVGVTATIDRMKGYAIDQLRELASELDPTLTEEEINVLTYDQLVNVVKLYHLEVIDLASVKLEELYQKAKQYDIHFTEKEAVKQAVDSLDVVYQASIALYDDIYLQLDNAYQTIQETYQQYFINENSSYQQALKKLAEKKNELIVQRNLVANLSEDTDSLTRIEETAKLSFLETEYATYEQSLKTAEQIAENVYAATCEIFDSLLTKMKELENELPESISAITFATLQDTESKMNAYKDNFFTNFEQEFAEEIAKQKNNLQQRKKELKESLH